MKENKLSTKRWKNVRLADIANVDMGQSPPSKTYNYEKNGLPFFQGKSEFGKLYPTIVKYCSNPIKVAEKNDILISVRAPIGATNIAPEKCCIGRGLACIRAFGKIPHFYILWFLRAIERDIVNLEQALFLKLYPKIY
jgi:type I restriction enzyme S subunit